MSADAGNMDETHTEPTPDDLNHPVFLAVWNAIKQWDIQRFTGAGYGPATGTDVVTIMRAIRETESGDAHGTS